VKERALRRRREQLKLRLEFMEGFRKACVKCGSTDIAVLQVHHIERSNDSLKDYKRTGMFKGKPATLLCSNCHRKRELELRGINIEEIYRAIGGGRKMEKEVYTGEEAERLIEKVFGR
jgi:hypothetical protein